MSLKPLVALGLLPLLIAGSLAAQPKPGDLIVGHQNTPTAVFTTTPGSNTMVPHALLPTSSLRGVVVGPLNTDIFVASMLSVFRVTPKGAVQTLVPNLSVGRVCVWCDLDEDGQLLVGTGYTGAGALFRVDPNTGRYTTVLQGIFPNSFCLDRDSGDIVMVDYTPTSIHRIKRDGTVTTLMHVGYPVYGMDFHSPSGNMLVAGNSNIYKLDGSNRWSVFSPNVGTVKAIAVLSDGTMAIGYNGSFDIRHLDAGGKFITTLYYRPPIPLRNTCMRVVDERNMWGVNGPARGALFSLHVRFASHPGKAYVSAASFSPRPGFTLAGKWIPLNIDGLFQASLTQPSIFLNFTGFLDATGRATPSIRIPNATALRGLRIFLATMVLDPQAPGGIAQVSQEYGATIQ